MHELPFSQTQKNIFNIILFTAFLHTLPLMAKNTVTMHGRVIDSATGQAIFNANIYIPDSNFGTSSDSTGRFTLAIPQGAHQLCFAHIAFGMTCLNIFAHPDSSALIPDVKLTFRVIEGREVSVQAEGDDPKISHYKIAGARAGTTTNPVPDPLLSIRTLPGVWSVNDQSGKFQVRGGSYDDNLIVINGVEIEQPHLVRKGVMENPSLINPYLVESIKLRTGAYPVTYGDRLASVLDVSYRENDKERWSGQTNVSMVQAGVALFSPKSEKINFSTSARMIDYGHIYKSQDTQGEYNPDYRDWQGMFSWNLDPRHRLSGYAALARSLYKSTPHASGFHYLPGSDILTYNIHYSGNERFNHQTSVFGIQWDADWSNCWSTLMKSSIVIQKELEDTKLYTALFPSSFAQLPDSLLSRADRLEIYNNDFTNRQIHFHTRTRYQSRLQQLTLGIEGQWLMQNFELDEKVSGDYELPSDPGDPVLQDVRWNTSGAACFLQYQRQLTPLFKMDAGVRLFRYAFNKETVFMPRAGFRYQLTENTETALYVGRYAQPPLFREIQFVAPEDRHLLKAQKAWQSTLSLRKKLPNTYYLQTEIYYKKMNDLISYDTFDVRTVYSGQNDAKGYAYGLDAMLVGEVIPDCVNWISYSYLIAKEDLLYDHEGWVNRPSAQKHTLSFNLQDKMVRFPGSRLHIRILFGTGSYYTWYSTNNNGDSIYTARNTERLPVYKRCDLGMTQRFSWKECSFVLREEILNLFDNKNVMSASWFQGWLAKYYLSGRNYNVGLQVEF